MRFIPISRAVPGMVLSKTIFDAHHHVLLGADMELTQEFIDRLESRGLPGFYIEDELTKDIVIEEVISEELRGRAVDSLVRCDIDATVNVVKEIVEELRTSNMLSLDLVDLRTFDEYTYRHSVNVAVLATIVGIGMNMNQESLEELCTAAILHDLGKLQIDAEILNKPSRLTAEEYAVMKTHSQLSYELIKNKLELSAKTKVAVLQHHENFDGTGYPMGLKGDEIYPFARIIHVVDVYDALTTARPYKSAYSPMESMEYLKGGVGIMFDREAVEAFMKYVPVYPKGNSVVLSTGDEAVVVENHMCNMTRPIVRTEDGNDLDLAKKENSDIGITKLLDNSFTSHSYKRDKRKHVLVVDDMVVNLKSVETILGETYRVSAARSADQALAFLLRKRPDIILMDIDMPGMDGLALTNLIKEKYDSSIPIIFVTALSNKEIVIKSKNIEAQDYVLKPFKPLYLLDRVSRLIGDELVVVQ